MKSMNEMHINLMGNWTDASHNNLENNHNDGI